MSESLTISFNPQLAGGAMYSIPLTGSNSSVGTIKDNNGTTVGNLNQNNPTFTTTGATSSITLQVTSGYYTTCGQLGTALSGIVGFQPSNDATSTTWGLGSNGGNAGLTDIEGMFRQMNTDLLTGTGNHVYFPNNCPTTITNMRRAFFQNDNVDIAVSGLSTWQTGNVTSFFQTFRNSRKIAVSLGNWDVTSATTFQSMFLNMGQTDALDATQINNWTLPSSSFTMLDFCRDTNMNVDISTNGTKWVMTGCTNTSNMFNNNTTFNQNIGNWDTSNITDMSSMFRDASAFNQEIRSWDVSSVTDFNDMFNGATLMINNFSAPTTPTAAFFVIDTTAPTISQVTAITTPGNDNTPSYVFSSDEVGTITSNLAFSTTTSAISGNNTITFNALADGTYTGKTITVTDAAGNASNTLTIPDFVIDTTAPTAAITYDSVGPYKNGETVVITATFNEVMLDSPVPQITITGSGIATVNATNMTKDSTTVYKFSYSVPTGDGTGTITLSQGTDEAGNTITATPTSGNTFTVDNTAPTISQVTAITTPGNDTTPSYVFSSDQIGTITSNLAFSSTTAASIGNNTITFNTLAEGTYTGKTITVTDAAGNASNTLTIPDFVIDTTAPVISQVTAITTPGNDTTPSYVFSSDQTGTITSNLTFTSSSAASSGNNTITFDTLAPGTYTGKTITVTDAAGNASNTLTIPDFVIDTTAPTAAITYDSVGPYKNGETVVITATFNEVMLDSPVPQITITGSGIATVNATNMTKDSTTVYKFSYSVPTGDGTGTITLTVGTDLAGNTITVNPTSGNTFTVDNTAPVISQVTAITTPGNDTTPSYVFTTSEAGTITSNLAFVSNSAASSGENTVTFSTLAEGTYTGKTITVTDAAGNASNTLTIPDFVIDTTAPVISPETAITTPGNDTTPSYVFSTDKAGTITSSLAFTSTTAATVGNNTVTFSTLAEGSYTGKNIIVTDAAGNVSNHLIIADFVIDTTLPVLTLIGANPLPAELGNAFTDPGATSNGGETVSVSGTVNKDVIGDYTLTYSATDAAGNTGTITRNVQVRDNTAPVITLNGANPLTIQQHGTYTEPGATADGGETVSITGSVNVDVLGNYTITYSAADNVGNSSAISRTVRVIDDVPSTITLIGPNPLILNLGATFIDPGATSSNGETVRMTTSLNTLVAGDYNVTYNSTDKNSNVGTAVRVVRVVNNEAYVGPKLKTLHNGITTAQNGMPLKDSTSDGGSSFSMGRMFFSRTYEAKPATEAAVLQVNKNKWIGSNRDASSVARNRRNQAIGSNELNTSGSSMAFTNTNEENNIRNAVHRTRSGGSRVPAKVFNKNSGGSFYS